jgi:hypothetical protein
MVAATAAPLWASLGPDSNIAKEFPDKTWNISPSNDLNKSDVSEQANLQVRINSTLYVPN